MNEEALAQFNILLVEDSEDDILIAEQILRKSGVTSQLHVVRDGEEALDFLFRRGVYHDAPPVALVVLDLGLPGVGGMHVLRIVRGNPRFEAVPVVVLTGAEDEERIHECMDLGTTMYLVKPMSIADVMNVVSGVQRYWHKAELLNDAAA